MKTALFIFCLVLSAGALAAQPAHSVSLSWAWTQGTGGVCSDFLVLRGTVSGGPYTLIDTTTACTVLAYTDASGASNVLVEGQSYFYVVQAQNSSAISPNSNEATAKIPFTAPAAPTNLTATAK